MRHQHEHLWRLAGAKPLQDNVTSLFAPATTVLLYRCEGCEEYKTSTLAGHWTLEDLQGRPIQEEENAR
jgi:hypothetical protein